MTTGYKNIAEPQVAAADSEERIGPYRVHPAAMILPEMDANTFEELRMSIEWGGQKVPIVVDGDVLLDGRHRLRACLALQIAPKVQQFDHKTSALQLIYDLNVNRRDLTPDQLGMVCTELNRLIRAEEAEKRKLAAGVHGKEGGRGHRKVETTLELSLPEKTLNTNSYEGFVPTREANKRSTVGQIAESAGISHHKAAQAIAVHKYAPELAEDIKRGKLTLKEAEKAVAAKRGKPKLRPRSADPQRIEKAARKYLAKTVSRCAKASRHELIQNLIAFLESECRA